MKKKMLWIIVTVIIVLSLFIIAIPILSDAEHIKDTNGSDSSLCTLTDKEIFAEHPSSISFVCVRSQIGNYYNYSVKKLSGVITLAAFEASGDKLTIHMDTTLTQGNLRVVLLCNGRYLTDIPVSSDYTTTIDHPDGIYMIRVAGESAEVKIAGSYSVGY